MKPQNPEANQKKKKKQEILYFTFFIFLTFSLMEVTRMDKMFLKDSFLVGDCYGLCRFIRSRILCIVYLIFVKVLSYVNLIN